MKRREFITLLGGAAATWPLAARAQQVSGFGASASSCPARRGTIRIVAASPRGVRARRFNNWVGPTGTTCHRCPLGRRKLTPPTREQYVAELIALAPDVILAFGTADVFRCSRQPARCQLCSSSVIDPVGAGFVESLARPGGQCNRFPRSNTARRKMAGAAQADRAGRDARGGCLRDAANGPRIGQFAAIQAVRSRSGVEGKPPINRRDAGRDRARRSRPLRKGPKRRLDPDGERSWRGLIAN